MDGIELLRSIKSIMHLIDTITMEIEKTFTDLTGTTVRPKGVDVQTSLPDDPMADKVIEIVEYREKLKKHQSQLAEKKRIAFQILGELNAQDEEILIMRYINGYRIMDIADDIGLTERQVTNRLRKAEGAFCEIYDQKICPGD